MFCQNCGAKIEEGSMFCSNCGSRLQDDASLKATETQQEQSGDVSQDNVVDEETINQIVETVEEDVRLEENNLQENNLTDTTNVNVKYCGNCGTPNDISDAYCLNCGASLQNMAGNEQMQQTSAQSPKQKKGLIVAGVAVVAVVVVAAVMNFGGGSKSNSNQLIYLKDNELLTASGSKYEPKVITDDYFNEDYEDSVSVSDSSYSPIQYTSDGKYMFYLKDRNGDDDLYYQKVGGKSAEVKLDSDILAYQAVAKDKIVYLKDSTDRKLYVSHLEDSEKVASDVYSFSVSSDDKYIMWREYDDGDEYKLYVQDINLKSDKQKIASITDIVACASDFSTIVYRKDDVLYVCEDLKEPEKIASNVEKVYVYGIDDKLEIYYTKAGEEKGYTLYDLVQDQNAASDAAMVEPNIEDYQITIYQDSYWGVREVTETNDAYYVARDAYYEKEVRDSYRETLKEETIDLDVVSLYYYSKGESELVAEFTGEIEQKIYGGTAMLWYKEIDVEKISKPELTSIEDPWDFYYEMEAELYAAAETKFINGKTITSVSGMGVDQISSMYFNQKTNEIYMVSIYDKLDSDGDYVKEVRNLYTWNYKNGSECELISDDFGCIEETLDNGIYYLSNLNEAGDSGDLYWNDTKLDSDVYPYSVEVVGDCVLYLKEINSDEDEGTLYCYAKNAAEKIADDVALYSYGLVEEDDIAYLVDYNYGRNYGDLMIYNGKKSVMVDSDVTCVFFEQ